MSMDIGDNGLLGWPTFHPESSRAALIGIGLVVIKSALNKGWSFSWMVSALDTSPL